MGFLAKTDAYLDILYWGLLFSLLAYRKKKSVYLIYPPFYFAKPSWSLTSHLQESRADGQPITVQLSEETACVPSSESALWNMQGFNVKNINSSRLPGWRCCGQWEPEAVWSQSRGGTSGGTRLQDAASWSRKGRCWVPCIRESCFHILHQCGIAVKERQKLGIKHFNASKIISCSPDTELFHFTIWWIRKQNKRV